VENWTGWKAVLGAGVIVGLIVLRVSWQTPQYREFDSGTWNIPPRQAMIYEIKSSRSTKMRFEITRSTPGPVLVSILDARNHTRVQQTPPNVPVPADVVMIYKGDGHDSLTAQDISLSNGSYFLYTDNDDNGPITVKFRLSEYR
jgi:hypothetical protein